jgi:hypothetical protein
LLQLDSNELWNRISTSDKNGTTFMSTLTDDSSLSIVSDENTNINVNSKNLSNSINAAKRNPNVLHSILSQQRPIAPKNGSPIAAAKGKAETNKIFEFKNFSHFYFSNTNIFTIIITSIKFFTRHR